VAIDAVKADGLIFVRGRGIPKGSLIRDMSVNDVTPTILAWLGIAAAQDMDGHPAAFVGVEPPAPVASYDTLPIKRASAEPAGVEEGIIEQLDALGYIDSKPSNRDASPAGRSPAQGAAPK
jgi:hypothetical protein